MSENKKNLREDQLALLREDPLWDVVIIGGGVIGAGIAVDAASRGLKTLLVEARDFSSGASSRSSQLMLGDIRALTDVRTWGQLIGSLKERNLLLKNAPSLTKEMSIVVPCYQRGLREIVRLGLGLYDVMGSDVKLGCSSVLSAGTLRRKIPEIRNEGLHGGVEFFAVKTDDVRLNLALIKTAVAHGATAVNYMAVTAIEREGGMIRALTLTDQENGETVRVRTRMVFNAAGARADDIRRMVDAKAVNMQRLSRGTHIVVDKTFMSGAAGVLIPNMTQGRVLMIQPWRNGVLIGTTDLELSSAEAGNRVSDEEVEYLLKTASAYLDKPVKQSDVKASFAGIRSLYCPPRPMDDRPPMPIEKVSGEHAVRCEFGNMVTVFGGCRTMYRKISADAILLATLRHLIPTRLCRTTELPVMSDDAWDREALEKDCENHMQGTARLAEYAVFARDYEFARTAEDVLFRRLRLGQVNINLAEQLIPYVDAALRFSEVLPASNDLCQNR